MSETILIGEDDPVQRRMISLLLSKKLGYTVIEAQHGQEVLQRLEASNIGDIHAVLLDINMPGMDGFETLRRIRKYRTDLPVLMLTALDDTNVAVRAIREGANDFIVKPPNPAQLDLALKNAMRMSTLARELTRMKRDKAGALGFSDIIGHGGGLAQAIAYGRKAAASDVPVFIKGETSTGKELLARAIHGESKRVGAPFTAIHCSALPGHVLESTLFGHEKGALPGNPLRSIGKFREADRGTIFLDDIHLLPPEAQARLLRVLQQQEVEPVGAGKPVKINVRIISASDHDLKAEVQARRFREDLYFRLNVLIIGMPPLRERQADIIPLVEYFMRRLCSTEGLLFRTLSDDAKDYLSHYPWPGNVRELESLIHRALVLCESNVIDCDLLMRAGAMDAAVNESPPPPGQSISLRNADGSFKTMDHIETEAMRIALEHYNHNVTRAAEAMGIAKSTFYRKLKATGLPYAGDD